MDCDAGMFAAGNGSQTCVKCLDGQFQNNKGAARCDVCENDELIPNQAQTVRPTNCRCQRASGRKLAAAPVVDHSLSCSFELPSGIHPGLHHCRASLCHARVFKG